MCFLNTRLWYSFQRETNSSLAYAIKKSKAKQNKKKFNKPFLLMYKIVS